MTVLIILGVKNDTGDTDTSWLLSVAILSLTSEAKQPTEGFALELLFLLLLVLPKE